MITAVIAEKPSVAKDIANVLNVRERHDGYLSGNGYLVTWAFGHLVQLAMPEAYGYAGFRRENLPILPAGVQVHPPPDTGGQGVQARTPAYSNS